jgi:hypothetical protein
VRAFTLHAIDELNDLLCGGDASANEVRRGA